MRQKWDNAPSESVPVNGSSKYTPRFDVALRCAALRRAAPTNIFSIRRRVGTLLPTVAESCRREIRPHLGTDRLKPVLVRELLTKVISNCRTATA